jgi:hypothetical protein
MESIRRQVIDGNRIYIIDSVCMRIYNRDGHWLQMIPLAQAIRVYGDIIARATATEEVFTGLEEDMNRLELGVKQMPP